MKTYQSNKDEATVSGFGDEWTRFDQSELPDAERLRLFELYFKVFEWSRLPANAVGFDLGCGSGRWAKLASMRVGHLHCVDPSDALVVAERNLADQKNCSFHRASVDAIPLQDESMDFGYSLGVLHHVPDTGAGIAACVQKLKAGAPFLVYLYYAFDNRPIWFRTLWRASNLLRLVVSRLPHGLRYIASQIIAATVYWPLARFARLLTRASINSGTFPLSAYQDASFYTMLMNYTLCTFPDTHSAMVEMHHALKSAG